MPPGMFVAVDSSGADPTGAAGSAGAASSVGAAGPASPIVVQATELTRGPWDHAVMHGGGVCGLLGWAIERALSTVIGSAAGGRTSHQNTDFNRWLCSRLTVEILSGVPVCQLAVATRIVKLGRRTATVDAEFWRHDGQPQTGQADQPQTSQAGPADKGSTSLDRKLLARATSQWLLTNPADSPSPAAATLPPIPAERSDPTISAEIDYPRPGFNVDSVELRNISGSTETPGPGVSWLRLDQPLMAGEPTTAFGRIATLSDMSAAVGWDHTPEGGSYINTDVTLQLLRLPIDEWVLFESQTITEGNGTACNWSSVSDRAGPIGWVLQSKVEAPFQLRNN